ncbi:MAG: glycosyltransferase family 4 protein, partial [Candidatus Hodarchaeota archaeon]
GRARIMTKLKKVRILMFGPDLNAKSGISNVVNNWLEAGFEKMVKLDYVPTLKSFVPGKYFAKTVEALNAYFGLIKRTFKTVDIVHIHFADGMSFYRKFLIFVYTKFFGLKTVIHMHVPDVTRFYEGAPNFKKKLVKLFFNKSDAIFVLSESWKEFCKKISNNPRIYIVYNGASINKFSGKIDNKEKIVISLMGRLGKRKGVYDLLEAFNKLRSDVPEAHLFLGGDGDITGVKDIIKEKKLENQIHILGWVTGEQKIQVFKQSDIYVLPSYHEGLPVSIVEAMAAGAPIISTPIGGIPEAVIENRNGFLIKPGDVDALCSRLRLLLRDKNLRERMGRESLLIIQEKFDIEKITNKLVDLYNEILEET